MGRRGGSRVVDCTQPKGKEPVERTALKKKEEKTYLNI